MTDFLSTAEIGERLGVTARRVQELAKSGLIPSVRHGRCIRIPRAAWESFVAAQTEVALSSMKGNGSHARAA